LFGDVIHVTVTSADKDRRVIERTVRDAGIEINRFQVVKPSLEDVYIQVMERADRT
jgi:hypothetical protein